MAATTNLMSWEAFEQLPDGDGLHRELIEGELQILPPPKSGHSEIAHRIFKALIPIETRARGRAFVEAGYKLSADKQSWLQPDVSFLRNERAKATKADDYFAGAPELAIEVVSPSESAADLNRKIALYLGAGSLAVWVVYPGQQEVRVEMPAGISRRLEVDGVVSVPELLPDWELPVAKIFED